MKIEQGQGLHEDMQVGVLYWLVTSEMISCSHTIVIHLVQNQGCNHHT